MKLEFLPAASDDLARLRLFIEPKNPDAATRLAARLYSAAEALLEAPELGRSIEGTSFRKLVIRVRRSAYIMHYRVRLDDDVIVITRIWHGREWQV